MKLVIYSVLIIVGLISLAYFFGENGLFASILALVGIGGKVVSDKSKEYQEKKTKLENELQDIHDETKDMTDEELVDFFKDK